VKQDPVGREAFEKLKTLVGHWETDKTTRPRPLWTGVDVWRDGGAGKVPHGGEKAAVEMTTLYSRWRPGEANALLYGGNQPTMRGTYAPETKTITFDLVSIST